MSGDWSSDVCSSDLQNMQALIIRTKRRNTVIEVPFAFTTEKIGDKVKVTFPDPLVYNEIGSTNGTIFANAGVDVMFEIPTLFNGEYELTTENNFTLKDYTFVNTSENKKFTITRD